MEIEIGVLASQRLDRRIESYARLVAETAAWESDATPSAPASSMVTTQKARAKNGPRLSEACMRIRLTSKRQTSVPRYEAQELIDHSQKMTAAAMQIAEK